MRRREIQEIGEEEQIIVGVLFSGISEAQIRGLGYGRFLENYGGIEQARERLGKIVLRKYFADNPALPEDDPVYECIQPIVDCLYGGDMEKALEESTVQIFPSAAGRNPQLGGEVSYNMADATDARLRQEVGEEDLEENGDIMRKEFFAYLKRNPHATKRMVDVDGYYGHLLVCFGNNLDEAKLAAGVPLARSGKCIVGEPNYDGKDERPISFQCNQDKRGRALSRHESRIRFLDALLAEMSPEGDIMLGKYAEQLDALYVGDIKALKRDLLSRAKDLKIKIRH